MPAISIELVFIYFVLLSSVILTRSGEVDDESDFSYDKNSKNGPDKWGNIKRDWKICNTGKLQSPIDLLNKRVKVVSDLEKFLRDYKPNNATLLNRGHDMMLRWEGGGGYLNINGTKYELKQCHWHAPSEHKINGKRFSLEAHLVHETNDGKATVIGILYKIGRPDPFLTEIEKDLKALAETKGVERDIGTIDPKNIKLHGKSYYRYLGSLTVPPCTQGIIWTIDREVKTVTQKQMKLIREAVHDESNTNARPIQPINKRTIKLYKPKERS